MSAHTPGPWTINNARLLGREIRDADGKLVATVTSPDNTHAGRLDRARLIALAPEMAEALAQVAKGEGAFNRDPLKHAENVIEEHKAIARALLARLDTP